ncbi:hypothetical protein [Paenibacillus roseipurpureus]|uniref:hypothetical protein n=1 Tax=Paenibacillus roseopurpureus TaxID=2918901 RepID=UPI0028E3ADF5|nr:hypothetical protein [Paenibacillus sp. MBLB1832]
MPSRRSAHQPLTTTAAKSLTQFEVASVGAVGCFFVQGAIRNQAKKPFPCGAKVNFAAANDVYRTDRSAEVDREAEDFFFFQRQVGIGRLTHEMRTDR